MSYIEKKVMRPSVKQIEKLHEELDRRISIKDLKSPSRGEAFECIIALLELEPATFHRLWIVPLLDAGLSLEAAIACIVQSYFQPN